MNVHQKRQQQAKILRVARKIHRWTGVLLFAFFFLIAVTGLLLGWKKHSGGLILAKSYKGTSTDLSKWQSIEALHQKACSILKDSISSDLSTEIDRIDIRKDKGMVKFIFKNHYWGIQLDGATGKLLHIERRNADLIEHFHDASILDDSIGNTNGFIKLFYTTVMGIALLIFTITGFWLWYGPKLMRQAKTNYK